VAPHVAELELLTFINAPSKVAEQVGNWEKPTTIGVKYPLYLNPARVPPTAPAATPDSIPFGVSGAVVI
jgi:hypothetical protein